MASANVPSLTAQTRHNEHRTAHTKSVLSDLYADHNQRAEIFFKKNASFVGLKPLTFVSMYTAHRITTSMLYPCFWEC